MREHWAEVYESLGKIHDISLEALNSDERFRAIYNESSIIMEYMDKEPKFRKEIKSKSQLRRLKIQSEKGGKK